MSWLWTQLSRRHWNPVDSSTAPVLADFWKPSQQTERIMRYVKSAFIATVITSIVSLAGADTASAQFPTAGWLNRATGGRVTTPRPIQNMTPFQVRPAPTSTLSGGQNTSTWGQPKYQANQNPNANIKINAGTQRRSLYSIDNNGRVLRGNQQVGKAHQTRNGWISLGPGASFIIKDNNSSRTKVRSAGSYFK